MEVAMTRFTGLPHHGLRDWDRGGGSRTRPKKDLLRGRVIGAYAHGVDEGVHG